MSPTNRDQSRALTAIRRSSLSVPAQYLLDLGIFTSSTTYLDYGCGRGDDVKSLLGSGYQAQGWDPVHFPHGEKRPSDFVGCHYVINVIDTARERAQVIKRAWDLTRVALVISARLAHEQDESHIVPRGDGWVTSKRSFQHFFTQEELEAFITESINSSVDPIGPGIFIAFREEMLRQEWKASRLKVSVRSRPIVANCTLNEEELETLGPLLDFALERGRLPRGHEFGTFSDALKQFGSQQAVNRAIVQFIDRGDWKLASLKRAIDLVTFIALAQFDGVDRMSKLPAALQNDVRAHYGSFKTVQSEAMSLLLAAGKPEMVNLACRASEAGKLTSTALFVHSSALDEVPPLLRVVLGCSQRMVGTIPAANIVKFHRWASAIEFLEFPDFGQTLHPCLHRVWHLDMKSRKLTTTKFDTSGSRPVLHHLHELISVNDHLHEQWRISDESEFRRGLFKDPESINTEDGWELALAIARSNPQASSHALPQTRTTQMDADLSGRSRGIWN